jgi:uncharacterized membrane protein YqjE
MEQPAPPTVAAIARRLAASLLGVLHTRLSLAGLELEEEIERLIGLLVTAFAIVLFATLTLLVSSLFVVLACPEGERLTALGILALVYALLAALLWWKLRRDLKRRPPMFAATLAELENDRAAIRAAGQSEAAP